MFKKSWKSIVFRVLFRPEAEITPRTVPNIDDEVDSEKKTFEKVPEDMAATLTEIIKEAVPDD